jgi:hypothetical protein
MRSGISRPTVVLVDSIWVADVAICRLRVLHLFLLANVLMFIILICSLVSHNKNKATGYK